MKKYRNIIQNLSEYTPFNKKNIHNRKCKKWKEIIDILELAIMNFERKVEIHQKRLVLGIANHTQNLPSILD